MLLEILAQMEKRVILEPKGPKDHKEFVVILVFKVLKDKMVQKVSKEKLDIQEKEVILVKRVTLDLLD